MPAQNLQKSLPIAEQLETVLNRHFLACSAFVGTAVLTTSTDANASIVYSGFQNVSVPTTNQLGGIYLDLTKPGSFFIPSTSGGGKNEGLNTLLPGWDVNFYKGSTGNLRWYYNTGVLAVFNSNNRVAALDAGTTIDSSSSLGTFQTMVPEFTSKTAFMGLKFFDASNNPLYGWIRVSGGATLGFPATIVDWAYENSGGGIQAGATGVPEPSSFALGCLAAGAAGVAAWRKRKTA